MERLMVKRIATSEIPGSSTVKVRLPPSLSGILRVLSGIHIASEKMFLAVGAAL
jgi:hypothetical protein